MADDSAQSDAVAETSLPEIVVRERAFSVTASAGSGTDDTAASLAAAPGMGVYSAGGMSSLPAMRGLADDRIKIRIDGAEPTSACGNHMNAPLSYIDPTQVGNAKILAGITPVSMGGDSIAGTIDIASVQPAFAADDTSLLVTGSASITSRSIDNGISSSAIVTAASNRLSLTYSGAQTEADSYEDGNGRKVPDTLYKASNHAFAVATQGNGNQWVFKAGEQRIPYQGFPNQAMDMVKNHGVFANLGYRGDYHWGTLDAKAYWQDTRHKMGFFTPEKTGTMPMDTHGRDIGYTLKAELPLKHYGTVRIGNEFHRFALDDWWPPVAASMMMSPNTFVNIDAGKRERFALFAEWEATLDHAWTSLLGVRNESVKTDAGDVQGYGCGMMCAADTGAAAAFNARGHGRRDNNVDWTALLKYEAAPTASYEFGFAQKTRSPNLYERYTWGRGEMAMAMIGWFGDGNGYVGNIGLKPEIAHTVSATGDWHDADGQVWNIKVTPFYTRVRDYIDVDLLGPGARVPRLLQFANHGARLYGVNVSWLAQAWNGPRFGSAVFTGKFDWTRGKREDGGDLYHVMPPNILLGLEQTSGVWTNRAELQLTGRKADVDNRRLENVTGAYSIFNIATRFQATKWLALRAGVRNLFDRHYMLPLGGVNLAETPTAPLLGQGRSIDLGLDVKF